MTTPPRRLHLVTNPLAGACQAGEILRGVARVLTEAGVEQVVHESTYPGHGRSLTRALPLRDGDAVVGVGGDGTLHQIVGGMLERPDRRRAPVGLIPAGSGNSLMHDLGCLRPQEMVHRILAGHRRPLDVMQIRVEGEILHAFNILGWGLAARAARTAEAIRWVGAGRYTAASALEILRLRARPVRVTLDQEILEEELLFVLACNTQHTGTGMRIAPQAVIDDGAVDVIVARRASRTRLLGLLARLGSGRHLRSSRVVVRRVTELSVVPLEDDDEPLVVDGEILGRPPVEMHLLPQALELLGA
jgi:YegS/Rv2252/BmrU family lipid kinase